MRQRIINMRRHLLEAGPYSTSMALAIKIMIDMNSGYRPCPSLLILSRGLLAERTIMGCHSVHGTRGQIFFSEILGIFNINYLSFGPQQRLSFSFILSVDAHYYQIPKHISYPCILESISQTLLS
jgi:hypothetical protein